MEIIIKELNRQRIQRCLDAVQIRSRVRLINFDELILSVSRINSYFQSLRVTKRALEGTTAYLDFNFRVFPAAYFRGGIPQSTQCLLVYRNGSWRLLDVYRRQVARHFCFFRLSDSARAYMTYANAIMD